MTRRAPNQLHDRPNGNRNAAAAAAEAAARNQPRADQRSHRPVQNMRNLAEDMDGDIQWIERVFCYGIPCIGVIGCGILFAYMYYLFLPYVNNLLPENWKDSWPATLAAIPPSFTSIVVACDMVRISFPAFAAAVYVAFGNMQRAIVHDTTAICEFIVGTFIIMATGVEDIIILLCISIISICRCAFGVYILPFLFWARSCNHVTMNRANRLTFTTAAVRSDLWMTTQRSLLVGSHCVSFGERWNGMAEWLLDEYDLKVGLLMLEVRSWKDFATPDHPLAVHTIHESQYGMESVDLGASLTAVAKLTCLTSSAMAASTGNARAPITAGDALPVASENLLLSVINMSLDQGSIDSFAKETVQGQQMPVEFDVNSPPFFDDLAAGDHKSTGAIAITSSPEVMDWSASQALRPKVHTALSLTSGRNAHSWPSVQGDMANIKLPTKNTISAAHDRPHKLATTIADGLRGPITEVPVPLTSAGPTLEVMASGLTGFANATRVNAKTNGHIPPSPDKENQTKAFPGHNARFDKFAPPFGEKELVDSAILVHDNTLAAKGCEDDTLTENGFLSRKADQKGFCGSDFHGVESPQHEYLPFAIGEGNDDNGFSMCNDDENSNLQTDDAMDQSPTAHSNVDDFEAHNDGLISSVPAHDAVSRRFLNGVGFNSDRRSITDLNKHSNDCSFPNEGNDNPPTALDDGGSKLDTSPDFSDALLHKTILYIEKDACLPRYLTWGTECRFRTHGLTHIVKDISKGGGRVFYDESDMPHNLTNLNDVGWEKTGRAGLCKVFKCKQKSKSSKKGTGRHPPFPKLALQNCETLYDRLVVINWWLNLPRAERQTTLEKLGGNRHVRMNLSCAVETFAGAMPSALNSQIVAAERCRLETQSAS